MMIIVLIMIVIMMFRHGSKEDIRRLEYFVLTAIHEHLLTLPISTPLKFIFTIVLQLKVGWHFYRCSLIEIDGSLPHDFLTCLSVIYAQFHVVSSFA